ncbi:jouberin isoform X2 [Hyperolius riggenbachi]|uniref:jouberin isoform X2 n=1 Tax=Hyperolius riggenbachi TaxID=752182 RepID=UPI0035A3558A
MPTMESEVKARMRARFDEVFQSYAGLPEVKKKSKKKKQPEEHVTLQTFNNQSHGDTASEVVTSHTDNIEEGIFRSNTLRELIPVTEKDSSPITKEHKQANAERKKKKKKLELGDSINPTDSQPESAELLQKLNTTLSPGAEQDYVKRVKKKDRTVLREESYPTDFDDEDQLIDAYRLHVSPEETDEIKQKIKQKLQAHLSEHFNSDDSERTLLSSPTETKKKKRQKKKMLVEAEQDTSVMSLSELQNSPAEIFDQPLPQSSPDISEKPEHLPKPKGKKTKKKSSTDHISENLTEEAGEEESRSKPVYDDSLVLGVYVHRADKLKSDLVTSRPMVKIYIIDQNTGDYAKKQHSTNAVTSFSEQDRNEYILPMFTQPYDFKRFKTPTPEWDEQIIFNERFTHFLNVKEDGLSVIIFFEILDVHSENSTVTSSDIQTSEEGFQKIAWAFLKIVGANEVLNINKKLRLQLYYPPRSRIASSTQVFDWWRKYPRNPYPSTLYVTIKGLKLPDAVNSNMNLVLPPGSSLSDADLQQDSVMGPDTGDSRHKKEPFRWTRLPGQACRVPNRQLLSLRAGNMGCSFLSFSHDGRTLAAACANRDGYPIYFYEIPSGQYIRELLGHLNVVYDLCWSSNDQLLLSASSDATVRLWRATVEAVSAVKVLPHPTFVYTAKFHPLSDGLVVTGCYDSVIRVWNVKVKEINGQLLQEFDGHKSFINTLCFDAEGLHMFSGDSSGLIIIWNTGISRNWQHNPAEQWTILKEIKENDMKGIAVNQLQVHPNGRRLLIRTKDSTLRIMDLRILASKKYIGATNFREKLHSAFTPCGTFILAGSEDGIAYVWNAETGDQVAKYSTLSYAAPVRDVAYHPHEHMVAFCAFGENQPILVYIYDYKVAQLEAEAVHTSSDVGDPSHSDVLMFQDPAIAARSSMRMMKVKQKLDSVLNGSNILLPAPSLLSPHSKLRLTAGSNTQLQPVGTSLSGSFSPVGQPLTRTPSVRLQMINTEAKISSLKVEADSGLPIQETVVALYDYTAHRSDELSLHRSDIIHVLYKDNDNWWFGILQNGQQGYFPANYVAAETAHDDLPTTSRSHYPDSQSQDLISTDGPDQSLLRMSAVASKSKDLKFMSQHDTDVESPVTQRARQRALPMPESPDTSSQPAVGTERHLPRLDNTAKSKKKKSLKQIPTVGATNAAFVSDEFNKLKYVLRDGSGNRVKQVHRRLHGNPL